MKLYYVTRVDTGVVFTAYANNALAALQQVAVFYEGFGYTRRNETFWFSDRVVCGDYSVNL
jgi:hypothetical protein